MPPWSNTPPYLLEFSFAHVIQMYFGPVFVQKSSMAALLPVPTSTTAEYPKSKQQWRNTACEVWLKNSAFSVHFCASKNMLHRAATAQCNRHKLHCLSLYCHVPHLAYPCFPNYLLPQCFSSHTTKSPQRHFQKDSNYCQSSISSNI